MQMKQKATDTECNERIANFLRALEIAYKTSKKLNDAQIRIFKNKKRAAQRKAAKSKMGDENRKYVSKKKKSLKMRKRLLRLSNSVPIADDPPSDNKNCSKESPTPPKSFYIEKYRKMENSRNYFSVIDKHMMEAKKEKLDALNDIKDKIHDYEHDIY